MSKFDKYIDRVLGHEGGYVYHPRDPGGETKWGISKRSFPHVNIKELTREQAIEIYRKEFWNDIDGEQLPDEIAFQILDTAINHGTGNAIRFLQRAIGVADDGVFGAVSHARLRCVSIPDVVLLFNAERLDFYTKLSTFQSFGKGWVRRVADNLRYAAEDN